MGLKGQSAHAISREHTKAEGGKVYVQDRMAEHAEELFERLDQGAHIYFCGLKGMMPGILDTLQARGRGRGAPTIRIPCTRTCDARTGRVPRARHAHTVHVPVQAVAEAKGLSWEAQLETLKKNGQWHVEVY